MVVAGSAYRWFGVSHEQSMTLEKIVVCGSVFCIIFFAAVWVSIKNEWKRVKRNEKRIVSRVLLLKIQSRWNSYFFKRCKTLGMFLAETRLGDQRWNVPILKWKEELAVDNYESWKKFFKLALVLTFNVWQGIIFILPNKPMEKFAWTPINI